VKSLKRFLSITLSAALLCGSAAIRVSAAETTDARPTVTLLESGFENGLEAPFAANEDDSGNKATITAISLEGEINPYLHLTNRTAGSPSSTVMQNVKDQLKANGADGKYYISARIKLDTVGDTAYVSPMIRAGALQLRPFGGEKRFAVTNEWTEVGKNADGSFVAMSVANGTFDEATLAGLSWGKFYFELYAAESGGTAYDGDFSIDDVVLWFVPNAGAPEKVTEVGESILSDGTFDAHLNDPDYYNTQKAGGDSWYVATSNDAASGTPKVTATVEKEGNAAGEEYVHSGTGALHITNRTGREHGFEVDVKSIVDRVGKLAKNEHYYISVWVRAEEGQTIKVQSIFRDSLAGGRGNGYILPTRPANEYIEVTDEWTEVGIDVSGEYLPYFINGIADHGNFDPYGATWAKIRLLTEDNASFYVDDFKVLGPQPVGDAVEAFVKAVEVLPAPDAVTRSDEGALVAAETLYSGLNLDSLDDEQKAAVAAAKETLDAVRAAFDALPEPKQSFVPEYTYENEANLIAPYGDLESFGPNDYIWNEENSEGVPTYTLVTDPTAAHKGNNCLLISGREKLQHGAAYTLTDVIKDNGGGKYYFSCWMRTKNPGDEMDVFPLLYIGGQGKEFYIDNDTRYHITNEWTFVGVTYDNIEGYYKSNGEAIPDLDDTATYVALRFYGQNEMWESEEDGAIYPDYYIDDLKVWKYFDGQEDYVDPDMPEKNPETGVALPLALPVLGAVSLGTAVLTGKRKRK